MTRTPFIVVLGAMTAAAPFLQAAAPPGDPARPQGETAADTLPPLRILNEAELLAPPSPVESIAFGELVAFAGDEALVAGAVVGRPQVDDAQVASFEHRDGEWIPRTSMVVIAGLGRRDAALRLLAAAPGVFATTLHRAATDRRSVLVFGRHDSPAGWSLAATLESPSLESASGFGGAVVTDGGILAVGEVETILPSAAPTPRRSPIVHLYERIASGWTPRATIEAPAGRASPWFGASLALDGARLAVGDPRAVAAIPPDDGGGASPAARPGDPAGAQVLIHRREGDRWVVDSVIDGSSVTPWPGFGADVALEGDLLAVRAVEGGSDGRGSKVFVFRRDGDRWRSEGELVPRQTLSSAGFGAALAISRGRILVGDTHAAVPGTEDTGLVHGFERLGDRWAETFRLKPRAPGMLSSFGSHLAVRGDRALVNRTRAAARGCEWGGAYAFDLPAPSGR